MKKNREDEAEGWLKRYSVEPRAVAGGCSVNSIYKRTKKVKDCIEHIFKEAPVLENMLPCVDKITDVEFSLADYTQSQQVKLCFKLRGKEEKYSLDGIPLIEIPPGTSNMTISVTAGITLICFEYNHTYYQFGYITE